MERYSTLLRKLYQMCSSHAYRFSYFHGIYPIKLHFHMLFGRIPIRGASEYEVKYNFLEIRYIVQYIYFQLHFSSDS